MITNKKGGAAVQGRLRSILPPKWELASIISISFSISFMVFIYSPLDIYLHNPTGFVVGWRFLLPPLAIMFLTAFCALIVILMILRSNIIIHGVILLLMCGAVIVYLRYALQWFTGVFVYLLVAVFLAIIVWIVLTKVLKEKMLTVALLVMWGLLVVSYVQILFLNGRMTNITGALAEYGILSFDNFLNLLLWIAITLTPLCLWILFKVKKKEFKYEKALTFSVLIISAMQIAGLVSTAVSTDLPKGYEEDNPVYISYESVVDFSPDNNIIVFFLDRFDVEYMREALETRPQIYDQLDGFTFYENNISCFYDTFPSMTTVLTQHLYRDGLTFTEYWDEAWAQHSYIDTLRENGFAINLYIDITSTYGNFENIREKVDNLGEAEGLIVNKKGFLGTAVRLSLGRSSPYILKNTWLSILTPAFSNEFYIIDADPHMIQPLVVSDYSDWLFYDYIRDNGFTADSEKKIFTAMHLNCAHTERYLDAVHVCMDMFDYYFSAMKELGVYDNSTIIITGDHGARWDTPVTTGILIKPAGAAGRLIIDSETEFSHSYFGASILAAANLRHDGLGLSYFDIIDGAPPPARHFYVFSNWWLERGGSEMIALDMTYEITGDANDGENWTPVLHYSG